MSLNEHGQGIKYVLTSVISILLTVISLWLGIVGNIITKDDLGDLETEVKSDLGSLKSDIVGQIESSVEATEELLNERFVSRKELPDFINDNAPYMKDKENILHALESWKTISGDVEKLKVSMVLVKERLEKIGNRIGAY